MKLIGYLYRKCRGEVLLVAVLGLSGGLSSAALIAVVNKALHAEHPGLMLLAAFGLIALVKIVCGLVSNFVLVRLTQDSMLQLSDELCQGILNSPFRTLEKLGTARLFAFLTDDISTMSAAIQALPPLTVNLAILMGCAAYLIYLSWAGTLLMVSFVVTGAVCHKLLLKRVHEAVRLAREGRDTLFKHFRTLTDGIKELKLSRSKRQVFLKDDVGATVKYLREHNLKAAGQFAIAEGWSQFMFYLLMGTILFFMPSRLHLTPETVSAFVFTALYSAAPIWGIMGAMPVFDRGREALARLQAVGVTVQAAAVVEDSPVIENSHPVVEFRGVQFSYAHGEKHDFALGPLDLTLRPGELTFVIGGNGSGKSTFVRLLTGLYAPQAGEILLDGRTVTLTMQESYRQLFSVVYSDFFLFDRLPGAGDPELRTLARGYLSALELSEKVAIDGDRLSTIDLSQGQRRRLALLAAYLEDRPIFVLDEWAADQDPAYRQIFYTRLLPELKRKGKTVVVVTHDDRYFHLGDRILKLDYGSLVENSIAEAESATTMAS